VIPQAFSLKAMGIAAGACAVLLIALGMMTRLYLGKVEEVGNVSAQLKAEQDARIEDQAQAAAVNAENLQTIEFLDKALAAFREDAEARQRASDEAVKRALARASGLQRMLDAERRARERIYAADPDARAWAEALVPLAIEQRLRARG
jgi:hypothetical protein